MGECPSQPCAPVPLSVPSKYPPSTPGRSLGTVYSPSTAQRAHTADQSVTARVHARMRASACHVGVCGGCAERAADYSMRTHKRNTPPRQPYAHAHAIAWRGSFIAHSCVNERLLLINEHMSMCRGSATRTQHTSSVGADRRHHFGRLLVGDRLLGLPNQNEWQNCKARRGVNPHQIFFCFLGVGKCRKKFGRDCGRVKCAAQLGA